MRPFLVPWLLGLCVACDAPSKGPGLTLRLAAPARPGMGCLLPDGRAPDASALLGQGGTLRLSVVRRGADGTARFSCDGVARVPGDTPSLDLGGGDGARFDIYAEWFDPGGARAATGALPGLSLVDQSGAPLLLHLYRSADWSCPAGALAEARAFHSATVLPSGAVVLIGGIAALPEQGPSLFQLLNSVELYDPRGARFVRLQEATGVVPKGRAFHQAALLSATETTARILVVGGVTAPLRRAALDGAPQSPTLLRFTPVGTTQPAGGEVLTLDLENLAIVRRTLPDAVITGAAFSGGAGLEGGGLLVAGGVGFPPGREQLTDDHQLIRARPGDPVQASVVMISPWLVAPSVTPLPGGAALVLGAARSLPDSMPQVDLTALRVSGLGAGAGAVLDGPERPPGPATVFHTATRLGDQEVLVTGGFLMQARVPILARDPPPAEDAVRLYTAQPGAPLALRRFLPSNMLACGSPQDHYRPAGFAAASATASGRRALITGGTPTADPNGCTDCEPDDTGQIKLLCVLRQALLFDLDASSDSDHLRAVAPLRIGRMGHSQTLLPDGTILVAGGLVRPGQDVTPATAEAEVFSPRARADADPDDPLLPLLHAEGLTRSGMEVARGCRAF